MKRRYSSDSSDETAIDMTPMLDIVFIMLIFFIVTTSFVKEAGLEVNRPTASSAQTVKKGNIMVAIGAAGDVWVDKRRIEVDAVRANIERLRAESPDGAVVIQADTEANAGVVVKVMDQIKMAGVESISIAATNKD
ncbi:biopolymer transporter ExbD [Vibrio parahaemolyticus]|jgi:biopolymer transport protein ExbD|uniref:Biopolymer transporter ExbD n=3 Tax=Vibrio parahaemolyticus TaxID=670 RepID=A0A072JA28_VIBPH|nr:MULTISPECIES: biopolymer transporter ExbD [Vibrio]EFO38264.1 biopolymer transport protein exbD2 [Vibrio parahaemolyticus Peru-466]EFO47238.1 biopolymer transport protein exbD2 [Vibrio parahaemolyticus AQ4037]EFO51002.1 biopolymer transport protein exbD2 [Vibrio parahaemolyticus K5030]EJG0763282.1 biopolymer transporter ExbD [Vibrio parahaemolyticus O5:K30]EJG0872090.1 biopolymer transporter ExbD [Vibrio parahaemolyticus O3]EJG0900749.1 biopolymer transporter ExbD [Vibrio parahaemolyticus O